MKRQYIKPEVDLTVVQFESPLADSPTRTPAYGAWLPDDYFPESGGSTSGSGNVGWRGDDEVIDGDDMFARRSFGSLWD